MSLLAMTEPLQAGDCVLVHSGFVLAGCRIRWGRVAAADGDELLVRSRRLAWGGFRLALGPVHMERAFAALDGLRLTRSPAPGTWCALHSDWVCSPLTQGQLHQLRSRTLAALHVVDGSTRPAPAAVLG